MMLGLLEKGKGSVWGTLCGAFNSGFYGHWEVCVRKLEDMPILGTYPWASPNFNWDMFQGLFRGLATLKSDCMLSLKHLIEDLVDEFLG